MPPAPAPTAGRRAAYLVVLLLCVVLLAALLSWSHGFYREVNHEGEARSGQYPHFGGGSPPNAKVPKRRNARMPE